VYVGQERNYLEVFVVDSRIAEREDSDGVSDQSRPTNEQIGVGSRHWRNVKME
jgi:hypothetical protein